jgi:gamma-glutamylaminecyclotransferase
MTDERDLCFAFGSNIHTGQLFERCPGARILGAARVEGYELGFAGYSVKRRGGVATLRPNSEAYAPGILFDVDALDLATLDRFEGHPRRYERRRHPITKSDGAEMFAWVYFLAHEEPRARPSPEYVATIRAGYQEFGLDPEVLERAVRRSTVERVFVYGSLLRGEPNHEWLEGAQLVDPDARTTASCTLHDLGSFPALAFGGETTVFGELYEIDEHGLARLDQLEGHPNLYERNRIQMADGTTAATYVMSEEGIARRSHGVIPSGDWRRHRSSVTDQRRRDDIRRA